MEDPVRFAADLAELLVALRGVDADDGPRPGRHSAFRGAPPAHLDAEVRDLLARVHGRERDLASSIWRDALEATYDGPPQWFHSDVAASNLLVLDGALAAVIDFGCSGVGDPACDAVAAWTLFAGQARSVFTEGLGLDDAAWARGRGWALWKGLIMLTGRPVAQARLAHHVLSQLFAERSARSALPASHR